MKGRRTLPQLKDATLEAVRSCAEVLSGRVNFGVPTEELFQAKGVCAELMILVVSIRSFKTRYEQGFYKDADQEDDNGHNNYLQDCDQYREDAWALGNITGEAVASGDSAFVQHLDHAINFAGDPGSRRRYAVACAVSSIRASGVWVTTGGVVSSPAVRAWVERFLGEKVYSRSIDDDLNALKVAYEKEPVGRPKKRV